MTDNSENSSTWTIGNWNGDGRVGASVETFAELRDEKNWPGYTFTVRFSPEFTVSGLDIDTGGGEPLTTGLFRRIPVKTLEREALKRVRDWWTDYDATRPEAARAARPLLPAFTKAIDMRRQGRRGRNEAELLQIASNYVLCLRTRPRDALVALAEMTIDRNGRPLDRSQAAGLRYQAIKRGFLTKQPRHSGVAGGALTPQARRLIAELVLEAADTGVPSPVSVENAASPADLELLAWTNTRFATLRQAAADGHITHAESMTYKGLLLAAYLGDATCLWAG